MLYMYWFIFMFCIPILDGFSVSSSNNTESGVSRRLNATNLEENQLFRYTDMVNRGWNLAYKWDFYNQPLDWDISSAIRKATGGYIRIEDGELQFGYSTLGAIIFYKSNIAVQPNRTYLLIARAKGNNPYRAMIGFYTPPDKKLHHYSYIKNEEWGIVSVLYQAVIYGNQEAPKTMYPAIQVLTKQDNVHVDWIEFWTIISEKE